MSDWVGQADASLRRVRADIARAEGRAANAGALAAAMKEITGRAESARREVVAKVDMGGEVLELMIAPSAMQRPAARLAGDIVATIRAARADAQRQATEVTAELFGGDDPVTIAIRDHARG